MKVVILAGGFGTRLGDLTEFIPKPMVTINTKPILWHIMRHYSSYGFNEFILALGYKSEVVKRYFLDYYQLNSSITVDLQNGNVSFHDGDPLNWKVTLVDTGLDSMTGGRLRRLEPYLGDDPFLLTYGDGLSDINIAQLVTFHLEHGKTATISSVHPSARFGELTLSGSSVSRFVEKPQLAQGWVNGGFFVFNPSIFDLLHSDSDVVEDRPLQQLAQCGQLMAFQHEGFWQCMDTKRDRDYLEDLASSPNPPWTQHI